MDIGFFSSLTAFLGMIVGIFLGSVPSFVSWILAGTAGVFLYVALVDMVPELSSGHAHPFMSHTHIDPHLFELSMQVCGMVLGICIMLVLAAYEHELMESFGSH
jgi:zinc transporter 10